LILYPKMLRTFLKIARFKNVRATDSKTMENNFEPL
jgi:hypothetical protein